MVYGDLVLYLVFVPVALVASAFSLRAALGWWGMRKEAEADYAYRRDNGMIPLGTSKDTYVETYARVNGPRLASHAAFALWGVLLATPIIAKVLEVLLDGLWQLSGQSRVFEPGYLVWGFFIFFGLMGAWAGIGYLVARHYHKRAPLRFEDALKLANAER